MDIVCIVQDKHGRERRVRVRKSLYVDKSYKETKQLFKITTSDGRTVGESVFCHFYLL